MTGNVHALIGMSVAYGLKYMGLNISYVDILITGVASYLPDADHKKSLAGKILPLWLILEHRAITHSLFSLLSGALIFRFLLPRYFIGFLIGYGLHILADCTTPMGCPLLLPISEKMFKI